MRIGQGDSIVDFLWLIFYSILVSEVLVAEGYHFYDDCVAWDYFSDALSRLHGLGVFDYLTATNCKIVFNHYSWFDMMTVKHLGLNAFVYIAALKAFTHLGIL